MKETEAFNLDSFRTANNDHRVTGLDYLHAIYQTQKLPADFAVWMARLYWPEFKVVDGVIYVVENFDEDYYASLLESGNSAAQNQFWMNLLEITGLFENLSFVEAEAVANAVVGSWNAKLSSEYGPSYANARIVLDKDSGEVFITLGSVE